MNKPLFNVPPSPNELMGKHGKRVELAIPLVPHLERMLRDAGCSVWAGGPYPDVEEGLPVSVELEGIVLSDPSHGDGDGIVLLRNGGVVVWSLEGDLRWIGPLRYDVVDSLMDDLRKWLEYLHEVTRGDVSDVEWPRKATRAAVAVSNVCTNLKKIILTVLDQLESGLINPPDMDYSAYGEA